MKNVLVILAVIVVVLVAMMLFPAGQDRQAQPITGLPWQIETLPGETSRVFGLTLGQSSIQDARERLGPDMEIAVVAAPKEAGALEAYYSQIVAGVITGRMVLVADVGPETVARLRERALKSEYMESATRKFLLNPDDLPLAHQAKIATITFIPSANFDEETALSRFGTPRERIRTSEHVEHFLYPDKGLDLALDSKGKEVLQYVAPREFARLREPLMRAAPRPPPISVMTDDIRLSTGPREDKGHASA